MTFIKVCKFRVMGAILAFLLNQGPDLTYRTVIRHMTLHIPRHVSAAVADAMNMAGFHEKPQPIAL